MLPRLRNMTSLYLTDDTGVLCLWRIGSRIANQTYIGSAGGHFEENELNDPHACILREMNEELGLTEDDVEDLTMRYVTLRLKNGEIRQNYYFFARLKENSKENRPLSSTEGTLHHIRYEDLPELNMPISAKDRILHYAQIGRFTDKLYVSVAESNEAGDACFVELREF